MDQTERDHVLGVLDALYGDGAWEVTKSMTEKQRQRRQAQVGLASNIVGIAAGTAGTKAAWDAYRSVGRPAKSVGNGLALKPTGLSGAGRKVAGAIARHPKATAGAALGLQVANVAGDAVANRVLSRASKDKNVKKSAETLSDRKLRMVRRGVAAGADAAKAAPKVVESVKKNVEFEIKGEVSKMNTEKKQVFGWASVIEKDGVPVIDLQGDVMTIETIEKAAYQYVHGSRKGGRQHQRNGEEPLHVSDMIESFVLTPEKKTQMGIPDEVPTGWWVGFQVNDDDTWQAYKDGKLKEFSIHGSGTRKALEL